MPLSVAVALPRPPFSPPALRVLALLSGEVALSGETGDGVLDGTAVVLSGARVDVFCGAPAGGSDGAVVSG